MFLDKENNLKLGDFGLSKAMAQAAMTQTYVGVSCSPSQDLCVFNLLTIHTQTPYYMSPELINGQPYDVKSDIWALGCLIYELCAGQCVPFALSGEARLHSSCCPLFAALHSTRLGHNRSLLS